MEPLDDEAVELAEPEPPALQLHAALPLGELLLRGQRDLGVPWRLETGSGEDSVNNRPLVCNHELLFESLCVCVHVCVCVCVCDSERAISFYYILMFKQLQFFFCIAFSILYT